MTTPFERLKLARMQGRPTATAYINNLFDDFIELHGDRSFMDDMSVIGGIATMGGIPVTVVAQEKGTDIESRIEHNFGSPRPEGYRKALRLMKQAEKFQRPVISIIDTVGAYCGVDAEERGQGFIIANSLAEMMNLKTPCISVVIGEGGSGGALALGCSDRVYMLENAVYSILSPEAFASILWKDKSKAPEACEIMKITAEDLLQLKVIDGIISEPKDNNGKIDSAIFNNIKDLLLKDIVTLKNISENDLLALRYDRFRKIGCNISQNEIYK